MTLVYCGPIRCVPSQSTAKIKLELLPLTDGIITLDTLQIYVKEKGNLYVDTNKLKTRLCLEVILAHLIFSARVQAADVQCFILWGPYIFGSSGAFISSTLCFVSILHELLGTALVH